MTEDILQNAVAQPEMVQTPPVMAQSAPQEKMLPQSEVNDLVGRVRAEATEKGRREALAAQGQTQQSAPGGGLSEEQIRRMIEEQSSKVQQEQLMRMDAERIVGEFASKMDLGKDTYEDFEDAVRKLDIRTMPEIVQLANSVGNTADIMYDLAQNPYKIPALKALAKEYPHLARIEMQKFSKSIDSNKDAVSNVNTRKPLSQMKPSTGIVDNGPGNTLKDFKRQPWARG